MKSKKPYSALAMISQVGLNVLIPIVAMILLGAWIDEKFRTKGIALLVCTLIGIGAGLGNIVRLGRKI